MGRFPYSHNLKMNDRIRRFSDRCDLASLLGLTWGLWNVVLPGLKRSAIEVDGLFRRKTNDPRWIGLDVHRIFQVFDIDTVYLHLLSPRLLPRRCCQRPQHCGDVWHITLHMDVHGPISQTLPGRCSDPSPCQIGVWRHRTKFNC